MSERDPKLQTVIDMALSLLPHEMGCDNCFDYLAAYADHMTNGTTIPEHLRMVREHLARCVSCEEELTFLLEAMKAQGEEHNNAEGLQLILRIARPKNCQAGELPGRRIIR